MSSAPVAIRDRSRIHAAVQLVRQQCLVEGEMPLDGSLVLGGSIGVVVLVTSGDGRQWAVKQVPGAHASMLPAETEGLQALGASGTVAVPHVHYVSSESIIMEALQPTQENSPAFWQRLAEDIAAMQASTATERHGWSRDNWLGGLVQRNTWEADGYRFFAEYRIQRFLEEPRLREILTKADREAVDRFCERLPELIPPTAPVLLHGDLWRDNVLAGPSGRPTLIDPAVWYGWPEVDLSTMWQLPRPAASDHFFRTWEEITSPEPGWTDRAPFLHVRELLSVLAQFGDLNNTADRLRAILRPFRSTDAQAVSPSIRLGSTSAQHGTTATRATPPWPGSNSAGST